MNAFVRPVLDSGASLTKQGLIFPPVLGFDPGCGPVTGTRFDLGRG